MNIRKSYNISFFLSLGLITFSFSFLYSLNNIADNTYECSIYIYIYIGSGIKYKLLKKNYLLPPVKFPVNIK
jgi:hypothetical protein